MLLRSQGFSGGGHGVTVPTAPVADTPVDATDRTLLTAVVDADTNDTVRMTEGIEGRVGEVLGA